MIPTCSIKCSHSNFSLIVRPEALRDFLNSLTKSDWFAVRKVQVAWQGHRGGKDRDIPNRQSRDANEVAAAKRTRLSVIVRIDLIEFPSNATGKPGSGKAGAEKA